MRFDLRANGGAASSVYYGFACSIALFGSLSSCKNIDMEKRLQFNFIVSILLCKLEFRAGVSCVTSIERDTIPHQKPFDH